MTRCPAYFAPVHAGGATVVAGGSPEELTGASAILARPSGV
ncbi:MAG TPA: hypothetical protein VNF50_11455 [Acidimicrobiales bacterium]|nr:hypothetical protein [Acidimicrobiales bacterium]